MSIIITYDIPSKHREFKEEMFRKGYKDRIPGINCETIHLPNTTVYHSSKTAIQAREDAKATCEHLDIKLERFVATTWVAWAAICGEPFK